MTLIDWPAHHVLVIRGRWLGVRRTGGELRGLVKLATRLALPAPTLRVIEAGRVLAVEWPDTLTDLLRALPLGPRGDLRDAALTVMHDGARTWTLRARGIMLAASTVTPPPRRAPSIALRRCLNCQAALPPGMVAHYCSARCRIAAHRRRQGMAATVEPEARARPVRLTTS